MATNNIKIFDQNKANMLTDEAYNTSTQRLNGVQQGIASSKLQNKTLYQVSLVAYAIGQMMQANGLNANDADAVSTFAGNLSSTIVQKILDKADATEAKNFTVNDKFITPQTWKAAYDFMKADSDMVTSAVDDTHYITPKLLKEGANLFGGKVELEDGTITNWKTFNKLVVNKNQIPIRIADSRYVKQVLIDKMKRYYIIVFYKYENYTETDYIAIFDYKTNAELDKVTTIRYNDTVYSLNSHVSILGLSKDMFLLTVQRGPYNSLRPSCLAIDFSTGKFIVKNAYDSTLYGQGTALQYFNKGTYFNDFLFEEIVGTEVSGGSATTKKILKYDIRTNEFSEYSTESLYICIFSFLDNDGNFYIVKWNYSNRSNAKIFLLSSKDNFSIHDISFTSYTSYGVQFQYKNNYLYTLATNSNGYGRLYKTNLNAFSSVKIFEYAGAILTSSEEPHLMIVNDEETSCRMLGGFYGPGGEFELYADYSVPLIVSNAYDSGYEYILAYDTVATTTMIKYKKDDMFLSIDTNFYLDLVYAYFGAPVTEIPEST